MGNRNDEYDWYHGQRNYIPLSSTRGNWMNILIGERVSTHLVMRGKVKVHNVGVKKYHVTVVLTEAKTNMRFVKLFKR